MENQNSNKSDAKKKNTIDISSGSVTGSINIGEKNNNSNRSSGNVSINTGGGVFIGGNVSTGGGDFVGRDRTFKISEEEISQLFKNIYSKINVIPNLNELDKSDLKEAVREIEEEIFKKGDNADEAFLFRRMRYIQHLAPDILEVIISTFASPTIGFNLVFRKIADRMKA